MKKANKHVTPSSSGGWLVRKSGSSRASRTFDTQAEAVSYGRALAKKDGTALYVHGRDGSIKNKMSYQDSTAGQASKKR
ncbi:DUF2188 domain-containing protein [Luteibacter yeojuensis]|uniref:DUF2188 domain-containing protein n=1 Tax=Luteibacter yeojuensis TaxID=345309 RepID=A0A7X5QTH6_9GAMM|nr:DUF2188 domain-containing protein [Luteibacter yeojuensis]NID15148.1 DUF2188 domain-containing protein [Luteibacter yeojuensis]